jgi:hypothetical protein
VTPEQLREIDAEIHRKVFGRGSTFDCGGLWGHDEVGDWGDESESVPRYSTDVAAAWLVVLKMREDGWYFWFVDAIEVDEWHARFHSPHFPPGGAIQDHATMDASPCVAICRAALKTLEATS